MSLAISWSSGVLVMVDMGSQLISEYIESRFSSKTDCMAMQRKVFSCQIDYIFIDITSIILWIIYSLWDPHRLNFDMRIQPNHGWNYLYKMVKCLETCQLHVKFPVEFWADNHGWKCTRVIPFAMCPIRAYKPNIKTKTNEQAPTHPPFRVWGSHMIWCTMWYSRNNIIIAATNHMTTFYGTNPKWWMGRSLVEQIERSQFIMRSRVGAFPSENHDTIH